MRPPGPIRRLDPRETLARIGLLAAALVALAGCYAGPGPLEPPPGSPGGLCLEPLGSCDEATWVCEMGGGFCYDPTLPCRGVFCGEHGLCRTEEGLPVCDCDPGYSNERYALYCEAP